MSQPIVRRKSRWALVSTPSTSVRMPMLFAIEITEATIVFEQCYERGGKPMMEKRIRFAQATYDMYGRK